MAAFGGFSTWPHLADLPHGHFPDFLHYIGNLLLVFPPHFLFSPKFYAKDFAQILKESNLCNKVFSFVYANSDRKRYFLSIVLQLFVAESRQTIKKYLSCLPV
jgi:hypothetical protein